MKLKQLCPFLPRLSTVMPHASGEAQTLEIASILQEHHLHQRGCAQLRKGKREGGGERGRGREGRERGRGGEDTVLLADFDQPVLQTCLCEDSCLLKVPHTAVEEHIHQRSTTNHISLTKQA